ncbi:MAG: transposase, partial [bacterium]|nr:transposase [bacterium]
LTNNAADSGELVAMVEAIEAVTGRKPQKLLADAGYKSEENFQQLEHARVDGYISLGREGKLLRYPPGNDRPASQRMEQKLNSAGGRTLYRRRKGIVEPVVGWIKNVLGFRDFSVRGHEKVSAEWDLMCLAVNLRRMHRLRTWG